MKTFTAALIATLLGSAFGTPTPSSSLPALPALPTGIDGLFVGKINDAGEFYWDHEGNVAGAGEKSFQSRNVLAERTPNGVSCNNYRLSNEGDRNAAVAKILDACQGRRYSRSIAFQSGNVIAYGCDYGNGQTCYNNEIRPFYEEVGNKCGWADAGWYTKNEWLATYGLAAAGNGFC